jgi:prophage regulatory protein
MDTKQKLLRLPTVLERTGLSRSALYEQMAVGQFPKSVPIGPRAKAWIEDEIDQHIANCISRREQRPAEKQKPAGGTAPNVAARRP